MKKEEKYKKIVLNLLKEEYDVVVDASLIDYLRVPSWARQALVRAAIARIEAFHQSEEEEP